MYTCTVLNTTYVGFHAQRTTTTDIAPWGQVVYNNVITNVGGAYDGNTGNFFCPVTGYYMFSVSVCSDVRCKQ